MFSSFETITSVSVQTIFLIGLATNPSEDQYYPFLDT